MRAAAAVCAGLLCALWGMRRASALRQDARRLHRWAQLLPHLALIISEQILSLPEALRLCAVEAEEPDRLLHSVAQGLQEDPLTSLEEGLRRRCPPWSERETLLRLFSRLGHGSAESRIQGVQSACGEIRLMEEAARERAARDAKLWQTLGFTLGACLTLLLL